MCKITDVIALSMLTSLVLNKHLPHCFYSHTHLNLARSHGNDSQDAIWSAVC